MALGGRTAIEDWRRECEEILRTEELNHREQMIVKATMAMIELLLEKEKSPP